MAQRLGMAARLLVHWNHRFPRSVCPGSLGSRERRPNVVSWLLDVEPHYNPERHNPAPGQSELWTTKSAGRLTKSPPRAREFQPQLGLAAY